MPSDWPNTSRGPCPTVMLWHQLPAGGDVSAHVDWLLAREPEADSPLLSFRLGRPLHELTGGAAMHAERIQDHRTEYLTYEGPVSGDRGTVARIAAGVVSAVRQGESGTIELDLRWPGRADSTEEMTVAMVLEENTGRYQVKMLAIASSSRYK